MSSIQYLKGTRLRIELIEGECYEGNYLYGDNSRITISDVCEYPSGIKDDNVHHFYKIEISSVIVLEEPKLENSINKSVIPQTTKKETNNYNNYVYISEIDDDYEYAIKLLNKLNELVLYGLGSTFGKYCSISLLAIGTKTNVFLFDIKLLQKDQDFTKELKNLIENENICKIVFNSKVLNECLIHRHKTLIKNVFDIQAANTEKTGELKDFADFVYNYLNIPVKEVNLLRLNQKQIVERPISNERKMKIVLHVEYMSRLKNVLYKTFLKKLFKKGNCYKNIMKNSTQLESHKYLNDSVPEQLKF